MNIDNLLELKWHIEQGNDEEASRVVVILAKEYLQREHPNLEARDPMFYQQVLHVTIPIVLDRVKGMFLCNKKNAS